MSMLVSPQGIGMVAAAAMAVYEGCNYLITGELSSNGVLGKVFSLFGYRACGISLDSTSLEGRAMINGYEGVPTARVRFPALGERNEQKDPGHASPGSARYVPQKAWTLDVHIRDLTEEVDPPEGSVPQNEDGTWLG